MSNMITIIFVDGSRFTTEVEVPSGRGAWNKSMRQVKGLAKAAGFDVDVQVAGSVVIDFTDVAQYNASETAEIFGFEG